MLTFLIIYGIIAFIAFTVFMIPVFSDWKDYSGKNLYNCILFSACVGLIWPVILLIIIALVCCNAYYARKDNDDSEDY